MPKARWASVSLVVILPCILALVTAAGEVRRKTPFERGTAVAFCSKVVKVTLLP